jgi:hypothetical protein
MCAASCLQKNIFWIQKPRCDVCPFQQHTCITKKLHTWFYVTYQNSLICQLHRSHLINWRNIKCILLLLSALHTAIIRDGHFPPSQKLSTIYFYFCAFYGFIFYKSILQLKNYKILPTPEIFLQKMFLFLCFSQEKIIKKIFINLIITKSCLIQKFVPPC